MSALSECWDKVAAIGVGAGAMYLGDLTGGKEIAIGGAGLLGFVLGRNEKCGPAKRTVRTEIIATISKVYALDDPADDLVVAASLLNPALEKVFINPARLAKSVVTPEGFPGAAVKEIMQGLARVEPELFGAGCEPTLTFRFARDVVEATVRAAIHHRDYFEKFQPEIIVEIGGALGRVETKIDRQHLESMQQHGVTHDQIALLLAKVDRLSETQEAKNNGVTGERFRTLAETALQRATTLEEAFDYLSSLVPVAGREAARLGKQVNADDFVQHVLKQADAFIAVNERDKANAEFAAALSRVKASQIELKRDELLILERAIDNDILRLDLKSAASRIAQKLELGVSASDTHDALLIEAGARLSSGVKSGKRIEFLLSKELAELAITQASNRTSKAAAYLALGAALQTFGSRGDGEAAISALNGAVRAYEAALKVYTRKDMPAQWAATQNNLGNAFQAIGVRGVGEAAATALNGAVKAFEAARDVYAREEMPANWATTQNNLGNALQTLGARGEGEAAVTALKGAVKAYEAALEVYTRKDMPAQWAMTQNNLGAALQTIGERGEGESAVTALNGAVEAYEAALEVYSRKDMPAQWAMIRANVGSVHLAFARNAGGANIHGALREAQAVFADALTVFNQPGMEYYRAKCQASYDEVTALLSEMNSSR